MKEAIDTLQFEQFTSSAFERIMTTLLDEIALGYVQGDKKLLEAFGVTPRQAEIIEGTDRRKMARRLVTTSKSPIGIGLDTELLNEILKGIQTADRKDRQCRELVNAGAPRDMLNDLGFTTARQGISSREGFTQMRATHPGTTCPETTLPTGRVQNLSIEQIQLLKFYWGDCRKPSEVDPIEHLLRSAHYINVHVGSIWKFIMEDPEDNSVPAPPPGVPRWVMVMFPHWGKSEDAGPLSRRRSRSVN